MSDLIESMAIALYPIPDGEDEATAFVCASGVAKWLGSPEARAIALDEVNRQAVANGGSLTYGETVDAVLSAIAEVAS